EAKTQLQSSLHNAQALSQIAKNQLTDPLEVLENLKAFIEYIESGEKKQTDSFKQALMLLAAPNSIAFATNKDIHISADQQINHSAGESINFSTQKSLIGHASQKISLFAAQEGAKLYAGKGKVELQAQDDAIEIIARKVIKLISTEDKIEMTSPKEIVLTAGGSQLKINSEGIFSTTGGKFESKAGQHSFVGGGKVVYEIPELPKAGPNAVDFLFSSLGGTGIENAKIQMYTPDKKEIIWEGQTNSKGKSDISIQSESRQYEALIGFEDWSSIFENDDEIDLDSEEEFEVGNHGIQAEVDEL
ncbi:MAG: DUF2345 domain-containing protein, partial [Acinetobacter sp.]